MKIKYLFFFVFLFIVAIAAEQWQRHSVKTQFPPPGVLVDLGERQLHVHCVGTGEPTVIFESGLDTMGSMSWRNVHKEIGQFTRACAYDRAGMMWSDPVDRKQALGVGVATDLNRALDILGEQGPFIFVAHSFGGPYAAIYSKQFPDDVAGVLFVDTSHPEQRKRFAHVSHEPLIEKIKYAIMDFFEPAWSQVGLSRFFAYQNDGRVPGQSMADENIIDAYAPVSNESNTKESHAYVETLAEAATYVNWGDKPLIAIAAFPDYSAIPDEEWIESGVKLSDVPEVIKISHELARDKKNWSSNVELVILQNTHHYVQFSRPDIVIANAKKLIDTVRNRSE